MNPNVPYVGNQDYRGYLNSLAHSGNTQAKQLITGGGGNLGYVDNTGNISAQGLSGLLSSYGGGSQGLINANSSLYNQYKQLSGYNPNANILAGSGGNYAVAAPNWDITSIYNNAGGQAAAQVNPYYTKQLQDFQTNQTQAKALQQQQHDLNEQNLEATLNNNLQGNELSRGRTSQDTLQNEQQIGIKADQQQQDQGTQFDQARLAQAKQLATQGLTTSGAGAQQVLQSQTDRNTQESRQAADTHQQVAAQELTKARTFEDLANSDVLSNKSFTQGQKQANIDWDKFVQGQTSDLTNKQNDLEVSRLGQLSTVQKTLAQQQINNMIHAISNPAQRAAAAAAYGGAF